MKKLFFAICCLLVTNGSLWAYTSYDFYAQCSSGQRLYYKYNDGSSGTSVTVTYPADQEGGYPYVHFSKPSGNLIIPSSVTYNGRTYSVTSIGDAAFIYSAELTSVTIPNSVTSIGSSAFQDCSGLTGTLTIPNSVTNIESFTFYGCSGLTGTLTIPNSVTSIGREAFSGCTGLTSVTIENGSIGNEAFYGCLGLAEIIIGSGVTSIGEEAFYRSIRENYSENYTEISSITCEAVTPPEVTNETFKYKCVPAVEPDSYKKGPVKISCGPYYLYDIPLYVPENSIQAYKNHAICIIHVLN